MTYQAQTFPGIYFETVQPAVTDALPRMDIASFAGFASSGPLHTPVAVESVQQFREVFGADVRLAWDKARNQVEKSYLGHAVESFFRNGGRRCWVVRVADESIAQTAQFAIPGLIRTDGSFLETAYADARSPGSWADAVSVRAVLQLEQLRLVTNPSQILITPSFNITEDGWSMDVLSSNSQIEKGDLISINLQQDDSLLYLYIDSITEIEYGIRLSGVHGYFYAPRHDDSPTLYDETKAIPSLLESDDFLLFNLDTVAELGIPLQWPYADADVPAVSLLRFALLTLGPQGRQQRLSQLAFDSDQERFWGLLTDDKTLYRHADGRPGKRYSAKNRQLLEESTLPRFPLAAPADAEYWHYLPVTMQSIISGAEQSRAEYDSAVTRLQREGIENFGSKLFLDSRLQSMGADLLKQQANEIAYLSESDETASLRGIHSLLLVDEASLIAVPDAIHRRWDSLAPEYEPPLAAPRLVSISETDEPCEYLIEWGQEVSIVSSPDNSEKTVSAYTLEWSKNADYQGGQRVTIKADVLSRVGELQDLVQPPQTEYRLCLSDPCTTVYYFRVRAERDGEVSPWSNSKVIYVPEANFLDCEFVHGETIELNIEVMAVDLSVGSPAEEKHGYLLSWVFANPLTESASIDYFEIQRASDRLFADAEVIFYGSAIELEDPAVMEIFIEEVPDSIYYYRARAISRKTIGPWSNTLIIWPVNLSRTTLQPVDEYSNLDLLAIHRALLRSASARSDLFAVLSLPLHYETQDVLDHYAMLNPGIAEDDVESTTHLASTDSYGAYVPPLTMAEQTTLTHGALYYPWVYTSTETNGQGKLEYRMTPPDGVLIGKISARSISHGAWIAPANSPLVNVLALNKKISDTQWQQLVRSRINVIRQAPAGFILLSAETLSTGTEYREINVRRLMSLLLKLALREGNRYVFEVNSASFREKVQQHFETVFVQLFNRGAFAGSTASQAYRVVTDSTINTPQSIDRGRFIVELQVAPSHALKFIRIRLMQSGPGQLQVQEVA